MLDEVRLPWRPIDPVPIVNGSLTPILKTVDTLCSAWKDAMRSYSPEQRTEARDRRLRRHAVETGIIERLYEVDWGTTEALVAEGLTLEAANRAGGMSEDTLTIIRSQYEALQYLTELARNGSEFGIITVRELHQIITRHQPSYTAYDQFDRPVNVPLRHGEWKQQPNHIRRPDGTWLECTPPEQVQSELERLIDLYRQANDAHPLVRTAWLHHGFLRIHPFDDGNGRVARALTLLALLGEHYAPLVVDRRERGAYLNALDAANVDGLDDLIRFFARLETNALTSTLRGLGGPAGAELDAAQVVRERVRDLRRLRETAAAEKRASAERLATEVHARIANYLDDQASALKESLREIDPVADGWTDVAQPPNDRSRWWRYQLVAAANAVDFYANLSGGAWWTRLQVRALGERLRYLAAVQKVGQADTGVLAVTVYAELVRRAEPEQATGGADRKSVV